MSTTAIDYRGKLYLKNSPSNLDEYYLTLRGAPRIAYGYEAIDKEYARDINGHIVMSTFLPTYFRSKSEAIALAEREGYEVEDRTV